LGIYRCAVASNISSKSYGFANMEVPSSRRVPIADINKNYAQTPADINIDPA
jgi:hypothetical protein